MPMSQSSDARAVFPSLNFTAGGFRQGELLVVAMAGIFGVFAYLSMASAPNVDAATGSPSNGIVLAALLLVQRTSSRWAIIVAAMAADVFLAAIVYRTPLASIGLPFIDAIEISTAFLIIRSRERLPFRFRDRCSLISFGVAAFAACAAAAMLAGIGFSS